MMLLHNYYNTNTLELNVSGATPEKCFKDESQTPGGLACSKRGLFLNESKASFLKSSLCFFFLTS